MEQELAELKQQVKALTARVSKVQGEQMDFHASLARH